MSSTIKVVSSDSAEVKAFAEMVVKEWPDNILEEVLTLPMHKVFVAVGEDGSIQGGAMICITPKNAYCLAYLLVGESFRYKGIGTSLLEKSKEFSTTENPEMELQLLVERWNDVRRKYYERHGFTFIREIPNYYKEGEDGCACLYALAK